MLAGNDYENRFAAAELNYDRDEMTIIHSSMITMIEMKNIDGIIYIFKVFRKLILLYFTILFPPKKTITLPLSSYKVFCNVLRIYLPK